MGKKRFQFDTVRFIVFLKVFLSHLPLAILPTLHLLQSTGAERFFFILSGFLITFIILNEKNKNQSFNFIKFIIKRACRIVPLYYLIIAFAFLTPTILILLQLPFSNKGYNPELIWSLTFMENYKMMLERDSANVSPLSVVWSLCTEIHFYILWGLAFIFLKPKNSIFLIGLALITATPFRIFYHSHALVSADLASNLDYFAFGAIPAYLYVMRNDVFEKWNSYIPRALKIFIYIIAVCFVFVVPKLSFPLKHIIEPLCFGILFMFVISFLAGIKTEETNRQNLFTYLGAFTYGMYIYHTIVINLMIKIFSLSGLAENNTFNTLLLSISSLLITIAISITSYHLFEKHFLNLGEKPTKSDALAYIKK
ncbi:MAG: acyltransferase [Sporocytophaga sp.]|uniref:acyltransferase family protein n=1 Tax=Sporocytophaga sp. TaxID=2231183 RepID=UPI001B1D944E|nr:acyltransferase [Sporocytophaga sp.]MBO9701432.1 acyltransferase [Sporocytophaga sp.]